MGAPGSLQHHQTNLTVVLLTGLVGPSARPHSPATGWGRDSAYLQIPLVFGLGSALVTIVGTNIGREEPARRAQPGSPGSGPRWPGAATGAIGLAAAVFRCVARPVQPGRARARGRRGLLPAAWDPPPRLHGLRARALFRLAGARATMLWPLVAGFIRLLSAAAGMDCDPLAGGRPGPASSLRSASPQGTVYGATVAAAIRAGAWGPRRGSPVIRSS